MSLQTATRFFKGSPAKHLHQAESKGALTDALLEILKGWRLTKLQDLAEKVVADGLHQHLHALDFEGSPAKHWHQAESKGAAQLREP